MTLERAAELVAIIRKIDEMAAIDLFCHFDDFFKLSLQGERSITQFALLCGYTIARRIATVRE
jgi:hypothetical protein